MEAGRLFNVFEIFSVLAAHRTAANEIHTGTYICTELMLIIQYCHPSVLFSTITSTYDQYSVYIQPGTSPGFRRARRYRPDCGPRHPLPKTESLRIWFTIFGGAINSFCSAQGGLAPGGPPPPPATSLNAGLEPNPASHKIWWERQQFWPIFSTPHRAQQQCSLFRNLLT